MPPMTTCRACRRDTMYMFLPLGPHPPANAFLRADQLDQPQPAFPLDTHVCLSCGLIQVPNVIPPDFFRNYVYVPSASDTLHAHFKLLGRTLMRKLLPGARDLVVDIGSNDGLLLGALRDEGARALGIEPAVNLTAMARAKGLEVINEYFTPTTARQAREVHGPAKVIVTTNTFNHIDDLHAFMEGVALFLDAEGTFVVEVPHSLDLVEKNEFDTVYHEHLSEFSVKSLVDLYAFFDMEVADVERLEIHGGSMRVFGRRKRGSRVAPALAQWTAREEAARLFSPETYRAFRVRVEKNRDRLLGMLADLKREGKRIVGYGAPAKGNTLLNYYGLGMDVLDYLVDLNPLKHGLYSPGMRIPVRPAEALREDRPDYLLILAWNFADEVIAQQHEFQRAGGRFIIPIPEPQVV